MKTVCRPMFLSRWRETSRAVMNSGLDGVISPVVDPWLSLTALALAIYNAIYGMGIVTMERTAKVFYTNRSQAVRLPKEFQFDTDEVFIHREGDRVILSPRPSTWDDYISSGAIAPSDFMEAVEDLPVQERER